MGGAVVFKVFAIGLSHTNAAGTFFTEIAIGISRALLASAAGRAFLTSRAIVLQIIGIEATSAGAVASASLAIIFRTFVLHVFPAGLIAAYSIDAFLARSAIAILTGVGASATHAFLIGGASVLLRVVIADII